MAGNEPKAAARRSLDLEKRKMLKSLKWTNFDRLEEAREELRADKDFMLQAVRANGYALEFASPELRADEEVVLEAVKETGLALDFASEELKANKDVALAAITQDGGALRYVDSKFSGNKAFVLKAVTQSAWSLERAVQYASLQLRADKGFVLQVLRLGGNAYPFASARLQANKQVLREAAWRRASSLRDASEDLQNDTELVLEIVRRNGAALEFASEVLRANREVVLASVQRCGWALKFASETLRGEKSVVLEAVRDCGQALQNASEELRADHEVVREAVSNKGEAWTHANKELQSDKDIGLAAARALRRDTKSFRHMSVQTLYGKVLQAAEIEEDVVESAIAAPGELAPVLCISLSRTADARTTPDGRSSETSVACEVSLLSGATFTCYLDHDCSNPGNEHRSERPGPTMGELAEKLLEALPKHMEVDKKLRHVHINILMNDDGDVRAVSPWDWNRPLLDFIPNTAGAPSGAKAQD